jgi:hypothetical protein
MNARRKASEYALKVKALLVQMAINDELPLDMNQLNTEKIAKELEPVFSVLAMIEYDSEMALSGDWNLDGSDDSLEGFQVHIDKINAL